MKFFVEPIIQAEGSVLLNVRNSAILCVPVIPYIFTDEQELCHGIAGVYSSSAKARRPCTKCLRAPMEDGVEHIGPARDIIQVIRIYENGLLSQTASKQLSLQPEFNPLLQVPGLNVFHTPSCRMHAMDLGIAKKLMEYLHKFLSTQRNSIAQYDLRWQHAYEFP